MATEMIGSHLLNMEISKEMAQEGNSFVLLEELSDPVVTEVSQLLLGENHLVSREDVTVIKESPAGMEEDIQEAQGVRVGTYHLGHRLLIPITTRPTVAGLDIPLPVSRPASDAEVPTAPVIVDCTDIGVEIRVRNVEKCTRLQLTGKEVLWFSELVGLTGLVDMKVS